MYIKMIIVALGIQGDCSRSSGTLASLLREDTKEGFGEKAQICILVASRAFVCLREFGACR